MIMSTQHIPSLIGLTGQAGTGKDTAADHLCTAHGYESDSFALPIKIMLEALFGAHGIDLSHLYTRALKESPVPIIGSSPRHMMQTLGTEWGRHHIGAGMWVRLAAARLGLDDLPISSPINDRIVLTDVRFAEEAAWIRLHGGVIVRITRTGAPSVDSHASETQPIRADHTIANDGTIPELHRAVDKLIYTLAGPLSPDA